MTQYNFGTGQIFTAPINGGAPLRLGALQDVSFDFSGDIKTLFGQYQYPLAARRGKTKIEGKIGSANIDVAAFNTVFFGGDLTEGTEYKQINGEVGAIPATPGPYTVVVANGAHFYMDLGVADALTGVLLKQVASGPAAGEYSVDPTTGTYTFASADHGKAVLFYYLYTDVAATGGSLVITNNLMGVTPKFRLVMTHEEDGESFTIILFSVVADKLTMPLKQDDFVMPEISYQAFADRTNRIGIMSSSSASGGGA